MKLYRVIVRGRARYAGTQADARAMKRETGVPWAEVEVPTAKAGLLAFLNEHATGLLAPAEPLPAAPVAPAPIVQASPLAAAAPLALDAASVLARMDNPDLSVDAIVEDIARMKGGYALKRVAGAVAIRFEELSR